MRNDCKDKNFQAYASWKTQSAAIYGPQDPGQ